MGEIDGIHELYYWQALEELETFEPDLWAIHATERADFHNLNRGKGKPVRSADYFYPPAQRRKKKRQMSGNEVLSYMQSVSKKAKRKA